MSKTEEKKEEAPKTESPFMSYGKEHRKKVAKSAGKAKPFGADLKAAAKEAIENDEEKKKKKKEEEAND